MFGFIKSIFGGIVSFLKNLLGMGKKSEYFLELDESKSEKSAEVAAVAVGTPEPEAVVQASEAKPAKSAKSASKAAASEAKASEPKAAAPAAATGSSDPAAIIAAAVRQSSGAASNGQQSGSAAFASNFALQMSNVNGRRSPGPSLNAFREMARQTPSARR